MQQLRLKYKNKADYSSGFAVFHTSVPRVEGKRKYANTENIEHVAILDLATFLEFFAQPVELADILVNKAKSLVSTWMEKNGGNDMIGKRRPISFTYLLAKYPWTSSKNRREESAYTLQLSSWGYTSNVQQVTYPKMGINDVKVRAANENSLLLVLLSKYFPSPSRAFLRDAKIHALVVPSRY